MSQNAQNVVKRMVVSLFFSGGGGIHHPPSNVGLTRELSEEKSAKFDRVDHLMPQVQTDAVN